MAGVGGGFHDPSMAARKKVRSSRRVKKARRKPDARVDICGQVYDVIVDPDLKIDGECDYAQNVIRVSPQAFWRMVDTLLHEALHALIDASGLGWQMRQRLKMSKAQWRAFEEDFIVRPMTPALLATLKNAGMLRAPAFLRKRAKAA